MAQHRRHILVFEPDPRGHAEEWLLHIARFICDRRPPVRVSLAVAESLAPALHEVAPGADPEALQIVTLDERVCAPCLGRPLVRAAFARWSLMARCLRETGADEGHFLCLDALSLPLALGLSFGGRKISGILFRPSVHYGTLAPGPIGFGEALRDARKRILYPMMLRNPTLSTVLSLDPYFASYGRKRYRGGRKIVPLADPAAIPTPIPDPGDHCTLRFPDGRTAFLLFGELTARKGILPLLGACALLGTEAASRSALIVAGRIAPGLRAEVDHRVRALRKDRPELWIEVVDRRLPESEIAGMMSACDVLLAPYQRFVGSSGLLVWAATFERPVITQDYGMLGRSVRDYGLGLAVDTSNPLALATALQSAVEGQAAAHFDLDRARQFAAHRDGDNFAKQVLGLDDAESIVLRNERAFEAQSSITA